VVTWRFLVLALGACSYDPSRAGLDPTGDAAGVDQSMGHDGSNGDADSTWCGSTIRSWAADFSTDPTTLDVDGDSVADWTIRTGDPFPASELVGGQWVTPPSPALDTRPRVDFRGPTRVDIRMAATDSTGNGATFWINVDYQIDSFAPIWVTLLITGGDQTLVLHGKQVGNDDIALVTITGVPAGLQDVHLEIDPVASTVAGSVGTTTIGPVTFDRLPRNGNDDRFGTVIAYNTSAEFDSVRIETCE